MSEQIFMLFQQGVYFAEKITQSGLLIMFLWPVLEGAGQNGALHRRYLKWLPAFLYFAAGLLFGWLLEWPNFIWNLICSIMLAFFLNWFTAGNRKLYLFLMTMFFSIRTSAYLISNSVYVWVINLRQPEFEAFPTSQEYLDAVFLNTGLALMVMIALECLISGIFLFLFRRSFKYGILCLDWTEFTFLILTPVMQQIFATIINEMYVIPNGDGVYVLFEHLPFLQWLVPIAGVIYFALTLLSISYWQRLNDLQAERRRDFVRARQIDELKNRLEQEDDGVLKMRKLRHEWNKHLFNLRGLLESGEYGQAAMYLGKLEDGYDQSAGVCCKTGNPVTDLIISETLTRCRKSGISLEGEFIFPSGWGFDPFDVGIILNNLLENAMEACELLSGEKRYIKLASYAKNYFFILEVQNPFHGTLSYQDGLPVSSKQDSGKLHGIGLQNVEDQARAYMGALDIQAANGLFRAVVMLQKPANIENKEKES